MIVSEKSYQNLSDYIQFLFFFKLNLIKKGIISSVKKKDSVIIYMIMLARSSVWICNPSRYTITMIMLSRSPERILI